jgi:hypothetical protein
MLKTVHSPLFWLLAMLLCVFPVLLQGADPAGDPAALKAILGSDPADWTITGSAYTLTEAKGLTSAGSVTLNSKTPLRAPAEYNIAFRLKATEPHGSSISIAVGRADLPDNVKQAFTCTVSTPKGGGQLNYSMSAVPADGKPLNGVLYLRAVSERSLGWSEEMRKTIEAQMAAAPKVDDLRCTLRLVVSTKAFRAWLNGRYVGELKMKDGLDPSGTIGITMHDNAELLSVRALPVMEHDARFEPIDLGGFVNASALVNGQRIAKLPAPAGQHADLNGITYRFPESAGGNDHLDLEPSWSRFGAISGYIAANYGTFGGRWIAADRVDPSRFCMYVPYGQYKALHLIAAFDGEKDNVPVVSAQFYRPNAGHPMNFSGQVPAFTAKSGGVKAFPVALANGKKGNLFHVIIPIDPDKMAWFSDLERVGLELTKEVKPYRGYPDPLEYSWHAGGLPSGVHVYAATLEKTKVEVDPRPDAPAHVWTAPDQPSYTVRLTNNTGAAVTAKLTVDTISYDGKDTTTRQQTAAIPADSDAVVKVALAPTRYGLQTLKIACAAGGENYAYERNFAYLHPDTRERGDWAEGKGPIIGYWALGGGHDTPDALTELTVMSQLGAETSLSTFKTASPEIRALAMKMKFVSRQAFDMGAIYTNSFAFDDSKYDRKNPEATKQYLLQELKKLKIEKSPLNQPEYLPFFPEPQLGRLSSGIFPHHYNGEEYVYTKEEEAYFQDRLNLFLIGARAVKEVWPETKILLPYGDPMYTAQFLAKSPEARELIDGTALDLPLFERLPEQQMGQVVLNRLYPIFQDIKKYIPNPYFVMTEGPAISSIDVDTTPEEHANLCTRNMLALFGYGVYNHESANQPFDCANYWGENHYGGGLCTRLPLAMPKIAYVSSATMTRHLNRRNFVKYLPTGSTTVYCQQYKHYRTSSLTCVLWTIRGTRTVTVKVNPGQTVLVYDVNDNPTVLTEKNGTVTFDIAQAPVYLEGMTGDAEITLGAPAHSDAAPAKTAVKLSNLGSGWTLQAKHDAEYENTNKLQIERFLGNFTAQTVPAPKAQGGKALAVHLGEEEVDRRVMPYYTTFTPKAPIIIPGKAGHLGLWVKAAGDWGRVVYSLRDANGERWLSVGTKEDWNSDDIRCWSAFCFDGWRYLRFQLPANAPYDSYRELGSTNWGCYEGDGIVDLPLRLEKIIVERRSSVIYGNELIPAKADDVLLGDLYAEYASPADRTAEAVRLSKLRMPLPAGAPAIDNPIAGLAQAGTGVPVQVLKVTDPDYMYDGTRCHVHFTPVDGAKGYDIWVAPYADGRGALKLGSNVQPGALIQGLRPEIDFYVFVTYTDGDGKVSTPSAPLRIRLKNRFVYK